MNRYISETVEDRHIAAMQNYCTNMKSGAVYWMVLLSMPLS